jgi:Fe-S-cluster containining protein
VEKKENRPLLQSSHHTVDWRMRLNALPRSILDVKNIVRQVPKRGKESSFPCFHCGVCCTKYQAILSQAEAQSIADRLGLTWEELMDRYVDPRWPGTKSFLLRQQHGACIFLEHPMGSNKSSCLIYPCKPATCTEWIPNLQRSECREGLAKYWGLTVSPSGELQGTEEDIRHFQVFLKSLSC